jgi:hypothetical protein
MTQMKEFKSKISRWAVRRKVGPNRAIKGPGRPASSDQPKPFLPWFMIPFDLGAPRSISSSYLWWLLHPIILPAPIHHKATAARWASELDELVARINTSGGKEARGGFQAVAYGCSQASSPPSSSTTFSRVSITLCASIHVRWRGNASVRP